METALQKLKRFNLIMGAAHLIQAIIMAILATTVIQKIAEFQPTITQNYLTYDTGAGSLVPASRELFQLPFGLLVAAFLLISAIAHGLIVLKRDSYFEGLKKGINMLSAPP